MTTFTITNSHNIPFTVRIVRRGDPYGLKFALTSDRDEPYLEFYDQRYDHTPHGQFVTRYFAKTLAEHKASKLLLDAGIPDWFIDGDGLQRVIGAACVVTTGEIA